MGESWYRMRAGPGTSWPALAGEAKARTLIVGGGLAGLATAIGLAERGEPSLLLEADRIGAAASGRNGGMASAGFTRDLATLPAAAAGDAALLYDLSRAAVGLLRQRIERHAIDCDLVPGVLEVAWIQGFDDLRRQHQRRTAGRPEEKATLELWDRARVGQHYRSPHYRGAILDRAGFHLDPLRLCRGLADAAARSGVRLHEQSPLLDLAPLPAGGWQARTAQGRVLAERVVLATGTGIPGLEAAHPRLGRALLPVWSYIAVTEPLGERLTRQIGAPYAVYDDRFTTGYYRPLPEGRLLWGGRVGAAPAPAGLERALMADLARVFPDLGPVRFDALWSGAMPFLRHRMPTIQEPAPGLWLTTGFGGHGLNTTTMAGELLAAALVDPKDDRWRLLGRFGLPWAGGRLGPWAARAYAASRILQDQWHLRRRPTGSPP